MPICMVLGKRQMRKNITDSIQGIEYDVYTDDQNFNPLELSFGTVEIHMNDRTIFLDSNFEGFEKLSPNNYRIYAKVSEIENDEILKSDLYVTALELYDINSTVVFLGEDDLSGDKTYFDVAKSLMAIQWDNESTVKAIDVLRDF